MEFDFKLKIEWSFSNDDYGLKKWNELFLNIYLAKCPSFACSLAPIIKYPNIFIE